MGKIRNLFKKAADKAASALKSVTNKLTAPFKLRKEYENAMDELEKLRGTEVQRMITEDRIYAAEARAIAAEKERDRLRDELERIAPFYTRIPSILPNWTKETVNEEREYTHVPSGVTSDLVVALDKLPKTALGEWDAGELRTLNREMQKELRIRLDAIQNAYDEGLLSELPASVVTVNRYIDEFKDKGIDNIYFDELSGDNLKKQYELLSRYLTEYKTGTAEGAVEFEREEFQRIAETAHIYGDTWSRGQRSTFWGQWRKITSDERVKAYISRHEDGKDYYYGSDIAQQFLYEEMESSNEIYDFDKAMDFILGIMEEALRDQDRRDAEMNEQNRDSKGLLILGEDDDDEIQFN